MRIRKRPMLPFFPISPPPQRTPDLPPQQRDERVQKKPSPREKLEEEEEYPCAAEAKERRSGFDPRTHHSKDRSDGWINPHEEMRKRCCKLYTPISKQVEAMEVKEEEGDQRNEDDEKTSATTRHIMSIKRSWSMNFGSAQTGSWPSSSREEGAGWQEGGSAFPFKKRKVHHQCAKEMTIIGKEKKVKTKLMKGTKMPKIDEEEVDGIGDCTSGAKKKKPGSNGSTVVIEGSRCSRVNGRGWRCCQQTLVGYSLCEHHLGKGRLRSMSSVRSHTSLELENNRDDGEEGDGLLSSPLNMMHEVEKLEVGDDEAEEEDEKLRSMVLHKIRRKKKKSGTLKARSISSLLGQTHLATTTATLVPSNPLV